MSKKVVKEGDKVDLVIKVKIDEGWYLYSNDFSPDLGPMLTEFDFESSPNFKLEGKAKAIKPKKKFDELWGGEYTYFTHEAEFRQSILIVKSGGFVKGKYNGQVCTEKEGKCIPVGGKFSVQIPVDQANIDSKSLDKRVVAVDSTKVLPSPSEVGNADSNTTVESTEVSNVDNSPKQMEAAAGTNPVKPEGEESLWTFFLLAMGSGFLALGTPCVFPIIPMTVSFFTKRGGTRRQGILKALVYGLSIIAIYTLLGTIVSRVNGAGFANFLSTHWAPNLIFFVVFVVFGLSFLGLFEITLPSSWVNKVDAQADGGGYGAVFFMALTLALVSFSCTGPIVGSVLVASAQGAILKPIIGMFGFSLALALPFVTFAIFPHWLSNLPKSGGWLNATKVVLGFLELALALKYFSTADVVYHWRLLDREIYLALWIVIFSFIGLYLLGKIRLPHDSAIERLSVGRVILAMVTFSFVVYMIPGLWGAPLKGLSGYLPPLHTQDYVIGGQGHSETTTSSTAQVNCETPKYADILHAPQGIKAYFDLKQAMACAKAQNKPVLIDFTGHGCVNCRKMEEFVWSDPAVSKRINEDFILVSLYVDERKELPQSEWYTSKIDGEVKKTIGEQNTDLQIEKYKTNSQPLYVITTPEGEMLGSPSSYDPDVRKYEGWLESGRKAFANKNSVSASSESKSIEALRTFDPSCPNPSSKQTLAYQTKYQYITVR